MEATASYKTMPQTFTLPTFGTLEILTTYEYYDGPVLFSGVVRGGLTDGFIYICVFCDEEQDGRIHRWMVVHVSPERLKKIEEGEIDIHDAFYYGEDGYVTVISDDTSPKGAHGTWTTPPDNIPKDYFPIKGERLS